MAKSRNESRPGRQPLSEAEKAARAKELKNRSKRQKFLDICTPRVNKALKAIDQIGNCSSSGYEFTEEDIARIKQILAQHLSNMLARFAPNGPGGKSTSGFSFDQPAA